MARFPAYFERHSAEFVAGSPRADWQPAWARTAGDLLDRDSIPFVTTGRLDSPEDRDTKEPRVRAQAPLSGHVSLSADAIARYVPWHLSPDRWGIYVHEENLWDYARDVALASGQPVDVCATLCLLGVLEHEYLHFEVEVAATLLESMYGKALYVPYLMHGYRDANPYAAPLEETLATEREVRFAKSRGRFWSPVANGVRKYADASGPGYQDWALVADARDRLAAESLLSTRIAGSPTQAPFTSTKAERGCVPLLWVPGDPDSPRLPGGALLKDLAACTVAQLKKWLRLNGFRLVSKKGTDHLEILDPSGRSVTHFDTMGGRGANQVYQQQADIIAPALGLRNARALFLAVRDSTRLTAPAPA